MSTNHFSEGGSVGLDFFFFFFLLLSAHLAVLLPGGHALVPGFSSLLEHVMSSPVNTSTIKSDVLTLFSLDKRVFGPSVTSIAIANANSLGDVIAMPSLSSTDKQRIDCVFFSYKILMFLDLCFGGFWTYVSNFVPANHLNLSSRQLWVLFGDLSSSVSSEFDGFSSVLLSIWTIKLLIQYVNTAIPVNILNKVS